MAFMFIAQGMYAQTVNGTVSSEDGPLPGASVVVKGSGVGTTTDFDGNFAIEAASGDVLVVSFVGFSSQEVTVSGQDQITVFLEPDNELEEVVVTGYGSQREKEITASVVKVEAED
ncbi:MAG: carboxypeptidase-like regulatory domain-containing protein, partial [Flavobacteriaceae bacterium]